ncbi:signal peptidase I [Streptomyces sp. NPDC058304]|uniref:signal peptidase I n=1 Tax=Streptomyces sp. NPDC058304 TaxID=3346437 RepID=UPI0036EA8462
MRPGRRLRITGLVLVPLGILLTIGTWLFADFAFGGHSVDSDGMRPTYGQGDIAFTKKIHDSELHRGDAVFYHLPGRYTDTDTVFQRVIGMGGDRVSCDGKQVLLNGKPLREPYVAGGNPAGNGTTYDVVVPEGRLFMLGDNRVTSNDSRYFLTDGHSGTIPANTVRERAFEDADVVVTVLFVLVGGVLTTLTGIGCGLAGYLIQRRAERTRLVPVAI